MLDESTASHENLQKNLPRQMVLYLIFAALMVILNIFLQNAHMIWIVPFVDRSFGNITLVQTYYLSTEPYNMPELIGSGLTLIITYITKFTLDKFIVFKKKHVSFQQTRREMLLYLGFAILTTIENVGIQFILGIITPWPMNLRIIIALTFGYLTKFFLDRKYSFECQD
jgi:putative flippase GtrA